MAPRVHYLCPDVAGPCGGVRVIYRHVDALNAQGIDAVVVHHAPGFRVTWFEHATRVTHLPVDLRPGCDVIACSEVLGPAIGSLAPGVRKVVFNQNAYYTFHGHHPLAETFSTPYLHPEVAAAIVVSEDSAAYLRHAFPGLAVYRTRTALDRSLYHPEVRKQPRVAFMPRRRPEDAQQVLSILRCRGALDGWAVAPIEGVSQAEAARGLRESTVFLSFGHPEGFGLPAAEAMACGCVVVGYHGNGGREFFTPEHGFPVGAGDIVGFATAAERVLRALRRDAAAFRELTGRASAFVRSAYSPEREREDVTGCWRELLSREPRPPSARH